MYDKNVNIGQPYSAAVMAAVVVGGMGNVGCVIITVPSPERHDVSNSRLFSIVRFSL